MPSLLQLPWLTRMQIIKYGLMFLAMIALFVAAIALRESMAVILGAITNALSLPAAAFRNEIRFNCSICNDI